MAYDQQLADAEREIKNLREQVAAANKWRIAFESLTPNGSEWVNDLPKCEAYVRDRMIKGQKAEMRLVHTKRALEQVKDYLKPYGKSDPFCGHCDKVYGIVCGALARSAPDEAAQHLTPAVTG